jgi:transposase
MGAWSPSRLTPAQLEARRFEAVRLLRAGKLKPAEIARALGVSRQSVHRWQQTLAETGRAGLKRRPHTGRPPTLTAKQWQRLARILANGATAAGFDTERWTLRRIAAVADQRLRVRYHFRSFSRVLRARGWSPQRPTTRALERNEALIAAWLRRDWPRLKKGLVEAGASLPSWTKQVTRFGPASAPRGPRVGTRPSSGASPSAVRSQVSSR